MIFFGNKNRTEKNQRFRRPEFQEKLARARKFQRQSSPVSESFFSRLLRKVGLGSIWTRALVLLVLVVAIYYLIISDTFRVETALLRSEGFQGAEVNEALINLGKKRFYLVPQNHMVFLNRQRTLAALQQELPAIREITYYRRIFPNKVEVALEKREPKYIWQTGDEFYFLDQDGVVFQKLFSYEPAAYPEPLIVDQSAKSVVLGERLKTDKILAFIKEAQEMWGDKISEPEVISYSLPTAVSLDIGVKTGSGFLVYFDLDRSPGVQIDNLAFILNSEVKPELRGGLSYIDLRLAAVGYYCFKDAPCALENATTTPR